MPFYNYVEVGGGAVDMAGDVAISFLLSEWLPDF